jgi:hypothetical protein
MSNGRPCGRMTAKGSKYCHMHKGKSHPHGIAKIAKKAPSPSPAAHYSPGKTPGKYSATSKPVYADISTSEGESDDM